MTTNPTFTDIFGGDDGDDDLDLEPVGDISDSDDDKPAEPAAAAPEPVALPPPVVLPKIPKRQPTGEESTKKKKKRKRDEKPEEEGQERPVENTIEDEVTKDLNDALDRIKSGKRKKKIDGDDPEVDEIIVKLVEKMKEAAYSDQDFNRKQQPAIAKVKLLPAVIEHLAKKQYFDQYLDNNILDGMKLWLEPLPADGSLPNLDVQSAMLTTLGKMPIRTEHLRESKIGRVVMFYSKCDRVLPGIQKIVKELLEKWMRPILGRSNNYKEKPIASANVDQRPARPGVPADSRNSAPEDTATRARVPQSVRAAFDIVPKSDLTWNKNDKSKPAANQYKKFKSRMQNLKKRSD